VGIVHSLYVWWQWIGGDGFLVAAVAGFFGNCNILRLQVT
jgi:hypothetical protein